MEITHLTLLLVFPLLQVVISDIIPAEYGSSTSSEESTTNSTSAIPSALPPTTPKNGSSPVNSTVSPPPRSTVHFDVVALLKIIGEIPPEVAAQSKEGLDILVNTFPKHSPLWKQFEIIRSLIADQKATREFAERLDFMRQLFGGLDGRADPPAVGQVIGIPPTPIQSNVDSLLDSILTGGKALNAGGPLTLSDLLIKAAPLTNGPGGFSSAANILATVGQLGALGVYGSTGPLGALGLMGAKGLITALNSPNIANTLNAANLGLGKSWSGLFGTQSLQNAQSPARTQAPTTTIYDLVKGPWTYMRNDANQKKTEQTEEESEDEDDEKYEDAIEEPFKLDVVHGNTNDVEKNQPTRDTAAKNSQSPKSVLSWITG